GTFPGFLDALNKAKYKEALNVLQNYASYHNPTQVITITKQVPIPVPVSMGGGTAVISGVNRSSSPNTDILSTAG
ncbi:MAG: hypothetical protein ACKO96_41695, partial [Flammeovirgaceae bacterium]